MLASSPVPHLADASRNGTEGDMAAKDVEKELVKLEKQYWQAIKDQDVKTAKELTDDECIVSGAQGFARLRKDSLDGMVKSPSYTLNRFRIGDDAEVRMVSDDVAVVAYKVHEELTVDGEPVTFEAADSSTWVRRDGRWLCALHTESIIGDPYGRDRQAAM
jgi:hypothetical protein